MNTNQNQIQQKLSNEHLTLIQEMIGGRPSDWTVEEIGDGNVNLIFRIQGPNGQVLIKQAVPYLRCVGESWPLSMKRNYFEYKALEAHSKVVPELMPRVFGFNEDTASMVMEFLSEHIILRKGMIKGIEYPNFAEHISEYMARTLFFTSDLALNAAEKKEKMKLYCENTDLCKITEDLIFTDPFRRAEQNRWTTPQLDSIVEEILSDTELKIAAIEMKSKFLTSAEALIHGDLHSGSIMVNENETKIIDPEFAFYGPMGFDTGLLFGNFLMSYFSQAGHEKSRGARSKYEEWILSQIELIWNKFDQKFSALWESDLTGDYLSSKMLDEEDAGALVDAVRSDYMNRLFEDTIRFAANEMIRRTLGLAHVADLDTIENADLRAVCETRVLNMARELLVNYHAYSEISEITKLARSIRNLEALQ